MFATISAWALPTGYIEKNNWRAADHAGTADHVEMIARNGAAPVSEVHHSSCSLRAEGAVQVWAGSVIGT